MLSYNKRASGRGSCSHKDIFCIWELRTIVLFHVSLFKSILENLNSNIAPINWLTLYFFVRLIDLFF